VSGASTARRLAAEALGTAFLLAAIVGSGIMAESLAGGNQAIALLAITFATGAALIVLIAIFAPISGAHFNPAVTLYFAMRRDVRVDLAVFYVAAQLLGSVAGVFAAHAMFAAPILEVSDRLRDGPSQALSEFITTFGLIATIAGALRYRPSLISWLVGLYIASAYWFTASTSFANPAVTIARSLTRSFAGIAPQSVPAFVAAQLLATVVAFVTLTWLFRSESPRRAN